MTDRQVCVVFGLGVAMLLLATVTLALVVEVLLDDAPWQHRTSAPAASRHAEAWPTGTNGGDW